MTPQASIFQDECSMSNASQPVTTICTCLIKAAGGNRAAHPSDHPGTHESIGGQWAVKQGLASAMAALQAPESSLSNSHLAGKAWINAACAERRTTDRAERSRYLAELEMRLQLSCEDLATSLEESSEKALQQIPKAVNEIASFQGELLNFSSDVQSISGRLESAAAVAGKDVAYLAKLHFTKTDMERASRTLKETSELAESFRKSDQILASGNLQSIASLLGTMQRGLSVVGSVPEFRDGGARLQALQNRFSTLLEPELVAAISHKKGHTTQQLASLLTNEDRTAALEKVYVLAKFEVLQTLWSNVDPSKSGQDLDTWLSRLFEGVLLISKSELSWAASWLPDCATQLVQHLLISFFSSAEGNLRKALATAVNKGRQTPLHALAAMHAGVQGFLTSLHSQFPQTAPHKWGPLLECIYSPFGSQFSRYQELEMQQIDSELSSIEWPPENEDAFDSTVERLKEAVALAIATCIQAADRCWQCTSGTQAIALTALLDGALSCFLTKLNAAIQAHADLAHRGLESTGAEGEATVVIRFTYVVTSVHKGLAELDLHLSGKLQSIQLMLKAAASQATSSSELAHLQIRKLQGHMLADLQQMAAAGVEKMHDLLAQTASEASRLSLTVQTLMYDALMRKLHKELALVPALSAWQESQAASNSSLPSFSAYPQPYATAVGEYLMMLPQLLEALPEDAQDDADWLDRVAAGAAEYYTQQLAIIPKLTLQGCQQLTADLEYFCNVLAALGACIPAALSTWLIASQWSDEEFQQAAKAAGEDMDSASLAAIAEARKAAL